MELFSCFRRERQRQSKSTVFSKFVRILKFVTIHEFQEFLKFINLNSQSMILIIIVMNFY